MCFVIFSMLQLQAMHGVHMALKIHTDMALVRTKDLDTYGECWNSVYIFVIAYERVCFAGIFSRCITS